MNDFRCIFCVKPDGPFLREEHIIPESCCNEDIVLPPGVVCDPCNQYFGQLDEHFVHHHAGAFHKLMYVSETKKGNPPTMPLKQGRGVGGKGKFTLSQAIIEGKEEDQVSLTFLGNEMILSAEFYPEPADATLMSRFLAKAGLETLYLKDGDVVFENRFDPLRNYARYGSPQSLFVPYAWAKGPWVVAEVWKLKLQSRKREDFFRILAIIMVPAAVYVIPLEHLDEVWALEKVAKLHKRSLQGEVNAKSLEYSIVNKPGKVDAEPIQFKYSATATNTVDDEG